MDIIKSSDSKYDEYESLLLERDQLHKEAGQIWTAYVREFGQLIADAFEEKVECIKCKKTIAYYQAALNHGGMIDQAAMQECLDQEMASYYTELDRMQKEKARCRDAGMSTAYEVKRSKELYRRLAKLLHPDINPETDRQEILRELWQRVVTAYGLNDVKELSELEVLVRKALKELGQGEIKVDIPDIDEKIDDLKKEIHEITRTDPYSYKELLKNEEASEKKRSELEEELKSYQKYHADLDAVIEDLVSNGGITFTWRMN